MPSTEDNIGKSFLIRTIEWGLNHPDGFNASEVIEDTKLAFNDREKDIIRTYLSIALKNHYSMSVARSGPVSADSLFLVLYAPNSNDYQDQGNKYVISLDSQFSFIDYQELKFARQNAREAKILSWVAIAISIFSLLIPVLTTQEVRIGKDVKIDDQQMSELLNASNNVTINEQQIKSVLEVLEKIDP